MAADTKKNGEDGKKKTLTLAKNVNTGALERKLAAPSHSGVVVERRRSTSTGGVSTTRPAANPPSESASPRISDKERQRRAEALKSAQASGPGRHAEAAEETARLRQTREAKAAEEEEARRREEEEIKKAEAERQKSAAPSADQPQPGPTFGPTSKPESRHKAPSTEEEKSRRPSSRRGDSDRRGGKITVTQALVMEENEGYRRRSEAAMLRAREKKRQKIVVQPREKVYREVVVPEVITVQELANRMAEPTAEVVKALMKNGLMVTAPQAIDADTAQLIVEEFGHTVKRVAESDVEMGIRGEEDDAKDLKPRPPVVTIMGHVDHGKTSLLDALRATDVVAGEAGGITQHIGAYQITMESGKKISFIDTPGHAAFTEMRARGANVTDIVVLVVAADDGIKEQTVEAISHAQAAEVPIIVAINKIDVQGADPMRVRTELLQHSIVVEQMGGEVLDIEVSALQKTNLDKLEEAILLQAEMLDLQANPNRNAEGVVVESKQEKGRGSVATILVQRGTLKTGDIFVTGAETGKVRALINDHGKQVKKALPAQPVEVWGLNGSPLAGDDFIVVDNEAKAREIADFRARKIKEKSVAATGRGTLEQMFTQISEGQAEELPILIKADVQGSLEAIKSSLDKISTNEVKTRLLHSSIGEITESDITLAKASNAAILGFNVRANPRARDMARQEGTDIRYYSIIYDLVEDMKNLLSGMLAPEVKEDFIGYAEILEVFKTTGAGKVAGCKVTEGKVRRGNKVRLLRDNVVIHEGMLKTLKRFKDEVKEVTNGMECGMAFENYDDIQAGDVIECFEVTEIERKLD